MCSGFGERHSAENVEKPCFPSKSTNWNARGAHSMLQARPNTMLPSFQHSTSAPPGPGAGHSGWLRPMLWSCASWSGSIASPLSFSSTAAHRRSAKGREGRWSHILERWQVFTARLRRPLLARRRREHALDVVEREHGAGNVAWKAHQILRFGPFF